MDKELFRKLSKQGAGVCPNDVTDLHTECLITISDGLERIEKKVDDLGVITIINGNTDGTPTMFQRSQFFQNVYNEIQETKKIRDQKEVLANSYFRFSKWASALIPILFVVALVLMIMGYQDLAKQISSLKK